VGDVPRDIKWLSTRVIVLRNNRVGLLVSSVVRRPEDAIKIAFSGLFCTSNCPLEQ
jgi:hypothetical protein